MAETYSSKIVFASTPEQVSKSASRFGSQTSKASTLLTAPMAITLHQPAMMHVKLMIVPLTALEAWLR